jgi:hypothetical protein
VYLVASCVTSCLATSGNSTHVVGSQHDDAYSRGVPSSLVLGVTSELTLRQQLAILENIVRRPCSFRTMCGWQVRNIFGSSAKQDL